MGDCNCPTGQAHYFGSDSHFPQGVGGVVRDLKSRFLEQIVRRIPLIKMQGEKSDQAHLL